MKILLLGGTGAMGKYLGEILANKGADVSVTTRKTKSSSGGIEYITGNAKDDNFLTSILASQWDCIVDFMSYSTEDFRNRVSLLLDNTSHYFFLSSARVYADSETPIIETSSRLLDVSTDSDFLKTDEYALAKARQEDILTQSGFRNWTIIRPYITYGEERLQLGVLEKEAWLFRVLQGNTIVFSKDIAEKTTTMTYGLDVASAIEGLIGNVKALGETFHITSDYPRTWNEILSIYQKTLHESLGIKPKVLLTDLENFSKTHSGRYQIIYDRLYNRRFDNRKIKSFVSTQAFQAPEQALSTSINIFLKKPNFLLVSSRSEGMKDQLSGEYTNLRYFKGLRSKLSYIAYRFKLRD
jgi:nucleoside-diphosphate-sugar epimerase